MEGDKIRVLKQLFHRLNDDMKPIGAVRKNDGAFLPCRVIEGDGPLAPVAADVSSNGYVLMLRDDPAQIGKAITTILSLIDAEAVYVVEPGDNGPAEEAIGNAYKQLVFPLRQRQHKRRVFDGDLPERVFHDGMAVEVFVDVDQASVQQHPYLITKPQVHTSRVIALGMNRFLEPDHTPGLAFSETSTQVDQTTPLGFDVLPGRAGGR